MSIALTPALIQKYAGFTLVYRASGLLEATCEHGVGHPVRESVDAMESVGRLGWGVHGCDGCCTRFRTEASPPDIAPRA